MMKRPLLAGSTALGKQNACHRHRSSRFGRVYVPLACQAAYCHREAFTFLLIKASLMASATSSGSTLSIEAF